MGFSQTLQPNFPVLEESYRRGQVLGFNQDNYSFNVRPIDLAKLSFEKVLNGDYKNDTLSIPHSKNRYFSILPLRQTVAFNTKRPYGWGNGPMLPNVGVQTYTSLGISLKYSILRVQLAPEFVYAQNRPFQGFSGEFPESVNRARFFYWSFGDYPERFGDEPISFLWWGQSKITIQAGFLEAGVSTENIFWGPGQFSSLTFSNNARSFPHFTLRTSRPAKTFLGSFEGEIIVGRLEDSGYFPSQLPNLNQRLFNRFTGDYKYLNAITLTYQPKWVSGFYFGISRTHQQYSEQQGEKFVDYFPIFEPFQKTVYGFDKDGEGRDQQVTFFGRWVIPKGKFEIYFEYGRRDHAYNWREAILNPEHARAYLAGFKKLWSTSKEGRYFQVRGEMLHQQQSVNRTIRYAGFGGGYTWHTHGQARGFSNYGEALGTGPGVGSNVQSLEISQITGLNKRGLLLERLVNHQDFFYRAFVRNSSKQPWVDYSIGLLWDQKWSHLILSAKAQYIYAYNYQWQSEQNSRPEFYQGKHMGAFFGQFSLLYFLKGNSH
ncbi:capsule assembly Wzi family protein [Algoriphagus kandeliae]|uniref:capsule assembly Wzi family protein n=1 Tax=Algoriphagus kandeliae TaxID=2562278 RepID=UPI001F483814|nr:capsule assembly Wzi family protein [Algoriphagus kandeliae]